MWTSMSVVVAILLALAPVLHGTPFALWGHWIPWACWGKSTFWPTWWVGWPGLILKFLFWAFVIALLVQVLRRLRRDDGTGRSR